MLDNLIDYMDENSIAVFLILFLVLSLHLIYVFAHWIWREIYEWYYILEESERKIVFILFGIIILTPVLIFISDNYETARSCFLFYILLFYGWINVKAHKRVINREVRESEIESIKSKLSIF